MHSDMDPDCILEWSLSAFWYCFKRHLDMNPGCIKAELVYVYMQCNMDSGSCSIRPEYAVWTMRSFAKGFSVHSQMESECFLTLRLRQALCKRILWPRMHLESTLPCIQNAYQNLRPHGWMYSSHTSMHADCLAPSIHITMHSSCILSACWHHPGCRLAWTPSMDNWYVSLQCRATGCKMIMRVEQPNHVKGAPHFL